MDASFWFVTLVTANSLLILLLALHVSRLRITRRIAYGDGGDTTMNQAIRAHANAVEHVTIYALMILALSMTAASSSLLAALVTVFTVSRLVHAYGMVGRVFNARRLGAGVTYLCELAALLALLIALIKTF